MYYFFFFNDTATTEIYTLSLHDALPISTRSALRMTGSSGEISRWYSISTPKARARRPRIFKSVAREQPQNPLKSSTDRKSTRLNSSHGYISYAVFCLKKKKRLYTAKHHH